MTRCPSKKRPSPTCGRLRPSWKYSNARGLCTKQDLYEIIAEFRRKNPHAKIPDTAFPEPYLLTETENKIIDDILALLNQHGLTSHQSLNLLERLGRIIEMGQRVAKGTTH